MKNGSEKNFARVGVPISTSTNIYSLPRAQALVCNVKFRARSAELSLLEIIDFRFQPACQLLRRNR